MALIDVVKYDANDKEFVWKFPSDDLRLGTQLVVKQSQTAFFVKGGQIFDQFESGTVTLKSGNIPLLNKLINLPFGGDSPFQSEVWFVNLISKLDNKWGTLTPIQIEDPEYGIVVPVRAFGQFGMKISEPRKFLETLVGTAKTYSADKIVDYFTGKILSATQPLILKKILRDKISVLAVSMYLDELSKFCEEALKEEFSKYGIEILNYYIISINIPESDPSVVKLKEAKELAMRIKTLGKDIYQMDRSFDVMEKAAENEGTPGNLMGAGLGVGMGFGVGGQIGNMMGNMNTSSQQNQNSQVTPPPPPPVLQFHVFVNNVQQGPYDLIQLKTMINQGQLKKDTLVWKPGMPNWDKAETQPELQNLLSPVSPPPPIT